MIDSRAKGRTAELKARDELRKLTGLTWERTPMSGALDAKHKLKGDVYVPQTNIKYCVEIKHYADDHISTKLITSKNPTFMEWWAQTVREANQMDKKPLLIFKHNRSKWFAATIEFDVQLALGDAGAKYFILEPEGICVSLLSDFCLFEEFV
jgi:hypothetical protein